MQQLVRLIKFWEKPVNLFNILKIKFDKFSKTFRAVQFLFCCICVSGFQQYVKISPLYSEFSMILKRSDNEIMSSRMSFLINR